MTRDWKSFFTADDFAPRFDAKIREHIAEVTNELLRAELERAPAARGSVAFDCWSTRKEGVKPEHLNTHSARLIDITKLDSREET